MKLFLGILIVREPFLWPCRPYQKITVNLFTPIDHDFATSTFEGRIGMIKNEGLLFEIKGLKNIY